MQEDLLVNPEMYLCSEARVTRRVRKNNDCWKDEKMDEIEWIDR